MKKEELIQKAYEIAVERYAAVGGRHRTSIENHVERVESFGFSPQYLGLFSPFCSSFSPYFGV